MSKSVLITGAHGFLGRHVARHFADHGYIVRGIGHGAWERADLTRFGFTFWHTADITLDMLGTYAGEPDVIVHCAGSGSVAFSMLHPHQDYVRTVSTTAAVLEYVRLHAPRSVVVYPSSAAVYGTAERMPINESNNLRPESPYGTHKCMVESLCHSYGRNFGVAVAVVRFFSLYGEGLQKQLLWDACSKFARGDTTFFGTGDEARDWLHVDDAARLLCIAAQHAASSCATVNGGSGSSLTVRDALTELFRAFGSNISPTFNGQQRGGDPFEYCADISAAALWGWKPMIGLKEGLGRYVDWFKACRT
jgi:UDP-glucose 4-epimerase